MKRILAVETSCDDTSAALVREDGFVEHHLTASFHEVHRPYGGIVPELASRNHGYHLLPLVDRLLASCPRGLDGIFGLAVTNRPGLIGSLMVGLVTVKTLSLVCKKPYVAVNHVEGHLLSPLLWDKDNPALKIAFPCLALAVSGAHTHLFIMRSLGQYDLIGHTMDDAAGEALDKMAMSLGLKYPGGKEIDRLAQGVDPGKYPFPRVKLKTHNFNFSFSGLKTAGLRLVSKLKSQGLPIFAKQIPYLCAGYQSAVVNHLISRLELAVQQFSVRSVILAGGVSANSLLRQKTRDWADSHSLSLLLPYKKYCTDNAAMIGLAGHRLLSAGKKGDLDLNCYPYSLPGDFNNGVARSVSGKKP